MPDSVAFSLKDGVKDLAGATTLVGDGQLVNIKSRLDNNDGVLTTSDASEIEAFRAHPALKEVAVPEQSSSKKSEK